MNHRNRSSAAGVAVAALGLSFGLGAAATADQDAPTQRSAPALSTAEAKAVKKLATRVAKRQIKRAAPTLTVAAARRAETAGRADSAGRADTATRATTADTATAAQTAANAARVGGLDVRRINTVVAVGGTPVRLIDHNGFTLTASCAGGVVELLAASTVAGGRLRSTAIDNDEVVHTAGANDLQGAGGQSVTDPAGEGRGTVTLQYVSAAGEVVNAWVGHRDDGPGCVFFGNYLVG